MVTVPLGSDSGIEGDEDFFARIFAASLSQVGFSVDTATVIIEDPTCKFRKGEGLEGN